MNLIVAHFLHAVMSLRFVRAISKRVQVLRKPHRVYVFPTPNLGRRAEIACLTGNLAQAMDENRKLKERDARYEGATAKEREDTPMGN